MTFRERLSLLLALYTKKQLADMLGVSPRTIENWLQGRTVSLPVALRVSDIYDLEIKKMDRSREESA